MRSTFDRLIGLLATCCLFVSPVAADDTHFFAQVVPIFQRRCIGCHNDGERKGELSLQSSQTVMDSGYLEPGDVEASRLFEVLLPVDGSAEMPKDADPLTAPEIAAIRKWIEEGAKWPTEASLSEPAVSDFDWWSLKPLTRPSIPEHSQMDAIRNPIDAFIVSKLRDNGLRPSPEADRQTLVRRLYFDLIGLPPTPVEVDEFVNDADPHAYDRLVDRLLESQHYGERWARHWLDVVHYADTHGYDKDKLRPNAWPYRDYVIRSLNADKPYSRFVMEQIAGDVLWPDSMDGITATGFIAAGPWDFIGHAEVPETKIDGRIARHLDRDDMVTSTMNTFVSTTVQCARCHNHKFDSVTQEHYYSLQAVFAALDRADRPYDLDPDVARERNRLSAEKKQLSQLLTALTDDITKLGGDELVQLEKRLAELNELQKAAAKRPEFGYHSQTSAEQLAVKWFQVDLGESRKINRIAFVGAHDDFAGIGHGFGFPLRYKIEVSSDEAFESDVTVLVDRTKEDVENPGTEPQTIEIEPDVKGRYVRMTATKLAERKDDYIFAMGEFSVFSAGENVAAEKQVTALDSIEAPDRWQRTNVVDGYWYGKGAAPDLPAKLATATQQRESLIARVTSDELRSRLSETKQDLERVDDSMEQLPPAEMVYAGTVHSGDGAFRGTGASGGRPRTIHVLHRGEILQPTKLVEPGRIPLTESDHWKFELPKEHSEGARRVELARWLTDHDNSLTWRSIVNRIWLYHFGRGIVDTPNDFGRMGGKPSHPELLDWLAVEFRDGGQSLKELHKLIVISAVYRQQSSYDDELSSIDSGNVFLWRMNRRRLSAEEVRDAVLHVSGKLNPEMYGPGMRLFELERPEHSPHYEYHKHDPNDVASHRRTIYRFIVRSQPDPFMTTLDCADSSQSVAKRDETVTALQALSLMNNKFMLAMSEHFAARVAKESPRPGKQVVNAFRLATGHEPTKQQRKELVAYTKECGLENTCRLLFNLNEFVFVD